MPNKTRQSSSRTEPGFNKTPLIMCTKMVGSLSTSGGLIHLTQTPFYRIPPNRRTAAHMTANCNGGSKASSRCRHIEGPEPYFGGENANPGGNWKGKNLEFPIRALVIILGHLIRTFRKKVPKDSPPNQSTP
jgi:hypothetical protein